MKARRIKKEMKKVLQVIFLICVLVGGRTIFSQTNVINAQSTKQPESVIPTYFPTYDETRVKYHLDCHGNRMVGMAPILPNDSLSEFVNNWYSKHLYSLGEPVIYNKTDETIDIIRFTHLGTWSNPYSYRIERVEPDISITFNKTDGHGGYEPGMRIEHVTAKIDVEKWDLIIAKMDSIHFWDMETHDKKMIFDGAEWIFEAFMNGQYHFVTRNSPDVYDGKEYAELCNLIVQIFSCTVN